MKSLLVVINTPLVAKEELTPSLPMSLTIGQNKTPTDDLGVRKTPLSEVCWKNLTHNAQSTIYIYIPCGSILHVKSTDSLSMYSHERKGRHKSTERTREEEEEEEEAKELLLLHTHTHKKQKNSSSTI